jgi:hypothetical protein
VVGRLKPIKKNFSLASDGVLLLSDLLPRVINELVFLLSTLFCKFVSDKAQL